jgi:hypothetical protein
MSTVQSRMLLSHFSSHPLGEIRSVAQGWKGEHRSCYAKPKGLWVSVDGEQDWKEWCEAESFGIGSIRYRVHLVDEPRLLILPTPLDLDVFTERYGREHRWGQGFIDTYIDWPSVAEEYSGIIIAPYQWARLELNWYYPWDCASGCIWNADAIARVEEYREAA